MPLPILETPKYEVKIPSTGKKVSYRPYLVKEEKILMIAMETNDQKAILRAMKDVITSCTFNKVDPDKLTLFDLEYLFLKLRAKSVGEISKLNLKCEKCEKSTVVEINVDGIEVDMSEVPSTKIKLTDKIGLVLTWPKVNTITELANTNPQDSVFEVIMQCIESIYDDKKVYPVADQTKEDLTKFIESLNQAQFRQIQEFIEKMPKLEHKIDFDCEHCKAANSIVLRGLQNFFS